MEFLHIDERKKCFSWNRDTTFKIQGSGSGSSYTSEFMVLVCVRSLFLFSCLQFLIVSVPPMGTHEMFFCIPFVKYTVLLTVYVLNLLKCCYAMDLVSPLCSPLF